MRCHRLLWLLPVLALSCASSLVSPPLPTAVRAIAVLPPNNQTGDPLFVGGTSLLEKYIFRSQPVTVADVLAVEVRRQLEQRGISVLPRERVDAALGNQIPSSPKDAANLASHGKLEGSVLYIEIVQWQPVLAESLHPWRMLVAIRVHLVDVASGRVVWAAHLPLRPVPTPGAVTRADADMIAAQRVAKELFSS
jgi:hypothetical protein